MKPYLLRTPRLRLLPSAWALLLLGACVDRTLGDSDSAGTTASSTSTGEAPTLTTGAPLPEPTTTAPDSASTTLGEASTSALPDTTTPGGESTFNDSDPEGCGFLCPPDGMPNKLECDVWVQDCPQGDKCTAYSVDGTTWDATKCVDIVDDPQPAGEACMTVFAPKTGLDDCDFGSMCFFAEDGILSGECVPLCTGTPDAPICPEGRSCAIANDGVLNLCLEGCDPLVQDCGPGQVCDFLPNAAPGFFTCQGFVPGDTGALEPCDFNEAQCAPGLVCGPGEQISGQCAGDCCTPLCDLGAPSCPDPAQVCAPWFEQGAVPPAGQEHVGVCLLP